jgi:hypothetical protein
LFLTRKLEFGVGIGIGIGIENGFSKMRNPNKSIPIPTPTPKKYSACNRRIGSQIQQSNFGFHFPF